jgi:hypothetical protein
MSFEGNLGYMARLSPKKKNHRGKLWGFFVVVVSVLLRMEPGALRGPGKCSTQL